MRRRARRLPRWIAGTVPIVALALAAAACRGGAEDAPPTEIPAALDSPSSSAQATADPGSTTAAATPAADPGLPVGLGRPPSPTPLPDAAARRAPGSERMVTRLAQIGATLDPRGSVYLGSERVALLRRQPTEGMDLRQRLNHDSLLALELIGVGELEEAAGLLRGVRAVLLDQPTPPRDTLHDLASLLAITYLRLGEQANCVGNHNVDSCLLPIRGGGVHVDPRGSRAARAEIEAVLASEPEDLVHRWLLNVAAMTLGTWPQGVPERWRIAPEVFASDVAFPRFLDVAPLLGVDVAERAGGAVLDDLDGDGDLDLMVSSWGDRDQLRYFENLGATGPGGTLGFVERTSEAGLIGITGGLNLVQADYDNDGLRDVLVLRGAWRFDQGRLPNSLLRNLGQGRFEDVTFAAGLGLEWPTQTAAWADYDGDGDLDLYVGHENRPTDIEGEEARRYGLVGSGDSLPNALYRNEGDGTFREVAARVGLDSVGFTKAVVWGDVDEDGDPDLFLSRMLQPNQLFRNDGPTAQGGWRFTDITNEAGVAAPIASFPAWFWDYDNDGRLDLFVSSYGDPADFLHDTVADVAADYLGQPADADRSRLYHNLGGGRFEDVTAAAGLDDVLLAMGANYGDLDNDGHPDLYVGTGEPDYRALMPNRAYRNAGDGTFQDVTTAAGLGHLQKGHGVAFGDVDHDGDQDLYAALGGALEGDWYPNAFFANPGGDARWLSLDLVGRAANRDAIGARIRVAVDTPTGPRQIHHLVGSGGSFGANSLRAEIGLGDATTLREIEIRWPGSGATDAWTGRDMALDGAYRVMEGGPVEALMRPAMVMPAVGGAHGGHGVRDGAEAGRATPKAP